MSRKLRALCTGLERGLGTSVGCWLVIFRISSREAGPAVVNVKEFTGVDDQGNDEADNEHEHSRKSLVRGFGLG